jgi:hypothetical protein
MCCIAGEVLPKVRPEKTDNLVKDAFGIKPSLVQAFLPCSMLDERVSEADIEQGTCFSTGQ